MSRSRKGRMTEPAVLFWPMAGQIDSARYTYNKEQHALGDRILRESQGDVRVNLWPLTNNAEALDDLKIQRIGIYLRQLKRESMACLLCTRKLTWMAPPAALVILSSRDNDGPDRAGLCSGVCPVCSVGSSDAVLDRAVKVYGATIWPDMGSATHPMGRA